MHGHQFPNRKLSVNTPKYLKFLLGRWSTFKTGYELGGGEAQGASWHGRQKSKQEIETSTLQITCRLRSLS